MGTSGGFDLAVIGAGPGGYVAAIRATQLGQKVAVIEQDRPGGVCLNWGCVPSKALLTGAELVENLRKHGETFGVAADGIRLDYAKLIDHSRKSADRLCKGVQALFKKNRIEFVKGRGRLAGPTRVEVSGESDRIVEASHILLATGSRERVPPGFEVDGECLLTSREALESRRIPLESTPKISPCLLRLSTSSAPQRRAFEGTHPQLRQTPPGRSRSMTATLRSSWAARIAAT